MDTACFEEECHHHFTTLISIVHDYHVIIEYVLFIFCLNMEKTWLPCFSDVRLSGAPPCGRVRRHAHARDPLTWYKPTSPLRQG